MIFTVLQLITLIDFDLTLLITIAFNAAGIDNWEKHVVSDSAFIRPNDLVSLHASSDKAKKELGWEPEWTFEKMIEDMVRKDIWRHSQ